jgi:hypothetical protein
LSSLQLESDRPLRDFAAGSDPEKPDLLRFIGDWVSMRYDCRELSRLSE